MKIALYAIGLATGVVLPLIAKKTQIRKAAVNVMAAGMSVTEDAKSTAGSIKEEAQDIYAEAKQKRSENAAKKQCSCMKDKATETCTEAKQKEEEKQGATTE